MSKKMKLYAKIVKFTPASMYDGEPSSVIAERCNMNGMDITGHHVAWARKCGFIRRVPFDNLYYGGTYVKQHS